MSNYTVVSDSNIDINYAGYNNTPVVSGSATYSSTNDELTLASVSLDSGTGQFNMPPWDNFLVRFQHFRAQPASQSLTFFWGDQTYWYKVIFDDSYVTVRGRNDDEDSPDVAYHSVAYTVALNQYVPIRIRLREGVLSVYYNNTLVVNTALTYMQTNPYASFDKPYFQFTGIQGYVFNNNDPTIRVRYVDIRNFSYFDNAVYIDNDLRANYITACNLRLSSNLACSNITAGGYISVEAPDYRLATFSNRLALNVDTSNAWSLVSFSNRCVGRINVTTFREDQIPLYKHLNTSFNVSWGSNTGAPIITSETLERGVANLITHSWFYSSNTSNLVLASKRNNTTGSFTFAYNLQGQFGTPVVSKSEATPAGTVVGYNMAFTGSNLSVLGALACSNVVASNYSGIDYSMVANTPALCNVALTGSYADLANKPTYATVATTGNYSDLLGKPTYATVATTGSYTDLINKPSFAAAGGFTASGTNTTYTMCNVGINNAAPLGALHVNYNGKYTDAEFSKHHLYFQDTAGSNLCLYAGVDPSNMSGYIQQVGNATYRPLLLQARGGAVGVGVNSNPEAKLTVSVNDASTYQFKIVQNTANSRAGLQIQTFGPSAPVMIEQQANSYCYFTNYANGPVIIQTANLIALQSATNPVILGNYYQFNTDHKINIDGNTFINGHTSMLGGVRVTNNDPGDLISKSYGTGDRYGIGQYSMGTTRVFMSGSYTQGSIRLSRSADGVIDGNAGFTDLMTCTYAGNVGIGTTAPSACNLLEVTGRVFMKQIRIKADDFPDKNGFSVSDSVGTRDYSQFGITTVERGSMRLVVQLRDGAGASESGITINHSMGVYYTVQITPCLDNGTTFSQANVMFVSQVQAKRSNRFDVRTIAMTNNGSGQYVMVSSGGSTFSWSNVYLEITITGTVFTGLNGA